MFGSQQPKPYSQPRPLGQDYRRSSSNEQGKALAVVLGRQRVGCEFISDVFDVMTQAVSSGGKHSTRVGTNYFASFLVAVCHGPVAKLHDVYFNGDPVFTNNTQIYAVSLTEAWDATHSQNVATFQTQNPHGLADGQVIVVHNCNEVEFNGEFVIKVVGTKQFQYVIPGAQINAETATAVAGASIFCYVKLDAISAAGADSTQFTIPNFGTATIYWGTQTQPVDAYTAQASGIQHPPYLGICYIVFRQLYLGFNQTNVQNIEVVVERTPSFPGMTSPAHAELNGDCNPACIAADLLLNPRYGLGLDPDADFDAGSFDAAAEQFYVTDGIAFSPIINRPEELNSLLTDMLGMVDAAPTLSTDGRLAIALQRQSTISATTVTAADLIALPEFQPKDWSSVVNQTFVNFMDRDAGWQPDFTVWNDTAAIYAKDRGEPQMLDKQFITQRGVAQFLAGVAGQVSALPKCTGKLTLAFDIALYETLAPGTGFTFEYSGDANDLNRNNGIYRVISRTLDDPAKPAFAIEVAVDRSYIYTLAAGGLVVVGLTPSGDDVPDLVDFAPFANFAILELPQPLCPDAKPAVACFAARDNQSLTTAKLYLGRNYTFSGAAPESYFQIQTITKFCQFGVLTTDFMASAALTVPANAVPAESADWPDPLPLTEGCTIQLSGVDQILPDVSDFDALAAGVVLVVGNEFMSIAEQVMTAPGAYTLTVIRGAFGTTIADHAAGDEVLIISREGIVPLQHPHIRAGNTAEFKLTLSNANVSDAVAFNVVLVGTYWNFPIYLQQPPAGM
jgi:hypothetical protein